MTTENNIQQVLDWLADNPIVRLTLRPQEAMVLDWPIQITIDNTYHKPISVRIYCEVVDK